MKHIIQTDQAPAAIGCYSQAVKAGNTLYISGQIGLVPDSMTMVADDFAAQAEQVFKNLTAIMHASGGSLDDIVKLTVYLTDLNDFNQLNTIMANYFNAPYPARAALQVSALPKQAKIEIDAIAVLP